MTESIDPEVLADLRLRASSQYDTSRTAREPNWTPPVFVGVWSCRNQKCRALVSVTQEPVDNLAMFNRELVRRGEAPIDPSEVLVCDDCRVILAENRRGRLVDKRVTVAGHVRTIKDSRNPRGEREAIAELRRMHHPDVDGLLEAVEARAKGGGAKRERKDSI